MKRPVSVIKYRTRPRASCNPHEVLVLKIELVHSEICPRPELPTFTVESRLMILFRVGGRSECLCFKPGSYGRK